MPQYDPIFLTRAQVEERHQISLALFGGAPGVRSETGLESALAAPLQDFCYANAGLFEIAAAYAFHIAQAQAYLDGNKRTAVACALVFLELNGCSTEQDSFPLYESLVAVAERRMTKAELAERFRQLFGR